MPGIGIVLNPKSRKNRKDPGAAARLSRAVGDTGVVREARSLDELHNIATDFKRLGIDVLAISGGDGTNHVTLSGFIDVYAGAALPQIALLRGGTMNTVANAIGVRRGRPEGLLARLVRAYAKRSVRPLANVERRVMRIGNAYGFLFGVGALHGFLAEYYRDPEPSPLVAAKTLLRGVGSALVGGEIVRRIAKPFVGHVEIDGHQGFPERAYLGIAAGTIDQMGLNFRPFYRCNQREDAFQVLGIHARPFQFCRQLPRVARAKPMTESCSYDVLAPRIRVHAKDGHVAYMVDGDLHETHGPLEISMGPRVRILTH